MRARRRFAQHFLEAAWVRKLLDAIAPEPTDDFIEIGAGRGALTSGLAARSRRVVAIEIDRDLSAELMQVRPANVEVVEGDVLKLDLARLVTGLHEGVGPPGRVRVAGNLPYNISSPILVSLMRAVRGGAPLHDAVLMLQREVADRVAGRPGTGDWGPLGIAVQLRAEVTRLLALPPGAFRPQPRVHSAVIRLRFRQSPLDAQLEAVLDSLVRAVFGQRRKTLLNALRPFATTRGLDPGAVLQVVGIDPQRRPETLGLDEFAALASRFRIAAADATAATRESR